MIPFVWAACAYTIGSAGWANEFKKDLWAWSDKITNCRLKNF